MEVVYWIGSRYCAQYLLHLHSVGVLGIEPSLPAPKAGVLPVYYTPIYFLL